MRNITVSTHCEGHRIWKKMDNAKKCELGFAEATYTV